MSDVFIFVVFFFSEVMKCCVRIYIYIYIHIIHLLQFTDGMFEFFRKDEPFLWNIKFMVSGGSLDCDKLTTAVKWKKGRLRTSRSNVADSCCDDSGGLIFMYFTCTRSTDLTGSANLGWRDRKISIYLLGQSPGRLA